MKFSEMKYIRPELEECKKKAWVIFESFRNAESIEAAERAFLEWDSFSSHIETMINLAVVRNTIDTTDKFYENEVEYIDSMTPELSAVRQEFVRLMAESRFRTELEEKYGKLMFVNGDIFLRSFSPEIIPETAETNKLETAYQKLIASAQIPFEGESRTISQMNPFKQSPDDKIRNDAWRAEGLFYSEHGSELDDIFDKMVDLRTKMARKLGFDNFVELGYLQMTRNCYDPEDISEFRKAVVKYIVPIAEQLYKAQAKRTGAEYPLTFADAALGFRDGNPMPQGNAEDILQTSKKLYHSLSGETGEFIDMMFENELMDVLSKKGKAGGGYCTEFPDYGVPFIFSNFNGTADDVEVMTHEAGHAFAFYSARNIVPSDNKCPTLDACEIHSMTMEFFGWKMSGEYFGKDAAKFRYNHLFSAVTFIPYGTMVDHFQHIIYEKPELSPEERHDVWRRLMGIYMPWIKLDGSVFYGEGKGWQRQFHIYENPFYYIDYCLAQTAALEFWVIMQDNYEEAWERYMRLVRKAGTLTFTELLQTAGLRSPFDEECLRGVAETAGKWLENNKITAG